jgi:hypothetical protein
MTLLLALITDRFLGAINLVMTKSQTTKASHVLIRVSTITFNSFPFSITDDNTTLPPFLLPGLLSQTTLRNMNSLPALETPS